MHFTPSTEKAQIQTALRDVLESAGGMDLARRFMDGDRTVIDELWTELAAMDYTAITVPEAHGGFGEDIEYLTFILEELGRFAVPGPYIETLAFCVPLLRQAAATEQTRSALERIAAGDIRMSFALYEDYEQSLPDTIQLEATESAGGYELDGTKVLVPYAASVQTLLVGARRPDHDGALEFFLVDVADVEVRRLDSLDKTRPMYEVTLSDVVVPEENRVGGPDDGAALLSSASARYNTAACAMLVGAAERTVELSVEYGKTREQFGQPIGQFQGVKHRIADMWMDMEQCRSLVYRAAWELATDSDTADVAVSTAKAHCIDRCVEVFGADIQNHGGTGFTWEHDAHIYLKQARAWEHFLGSPAEHRDRVADLKEI